MTRKPLAMKTLIAELTKSFEDAGFEATDVDGLGVTRTLIAELAPEKDRVEAVAFLLERDARIAEVHAFKGNQDYSLSVLFVSTTLADKDTNPFGIAEFLANTTIDDVGDVKVALGDDAGQRLYTAEELKGKKATTLADLVTHEDPTNWDRDEIVRFLTTGESPGTPAVDDDDETE